MLSRFPVRSISRSSSRLPFRGLVEERDFILDPDRSLPTPMPSDVRSITKFPNDSHIQLIQMQVFAGEFDIRFCIAAEGNINLVVSGLHEGRQNWIGIDTSGEVFIRILNTSHYFNVSGMSDGMARTLRIIRDSDDLVTLQQVDKDTGDTVVLGDSATLSGNFAIDYIASNQNTQTSIDGYMWDYRSSGDGVASLFLPLDSDYTTDLNIRDDNGIVVGLATGLVTADTELFECADGTSTLLGENMISDTLWANPIAQGSEWSYANDAYTIDSSGSYSVLRFLVETNGLAHYYVKVTVSQYSGQHDAVLIASSLIGDGGITSTGDYLFEFSTAVNGRAEFKRGNPSMTFTATISDHAVGRVIRHAPMPVPPL